MQTEFPDIRIIRLDQNYGFADGYNRALREVEATYYLLLNSDVEIRQPQWLNPMIDYLDAHPQVAACQPKLLKLQTHPLTPPCMEGSGHHEALPSDGNYSPPSQGGAQGESLFFEYAGASGGFIDRYGYPYCRGRVFDTIERAV